MKYALKTLGNFKPSPSSASFMKLSQPQPYLVTQNNKYTIEPIGSKLLLTMKSSRSKIPFPAPMVLTSDHTLKPNAHGIDNTKIITSITIEAFVLLHSK